MLHRPNGFNHRRSIYKTAQVSGKAVIARYSVLLIVLLLSLFYFVNSTQSADRRLQLSNQENTLTDLKQELNTLEINASRWRSSHNLNSSANIQGLVPIESEVESITVE